METMKNQDEINLINFFTRNKSLTRSQRARFESLVARDIGEFKSPNKKILNSPIKKESLKSKQEDLPQYISPKKIQSFLEQYNQNPILKYTCHSIDDKEVIKDLCQRCEVEKYNYEKHVNLIISEFEQLKNEFKDEPASEKMIALISAYLKGQKEWSSDKISINWSCDEIKKWAKNNPGIIPNPGPNIAKEQKNRGFRLNHFTSKLTNESIDSFVDLCRLFKSLFHIRRDNSLKKLISIYDININFSETNFRENIELFTDVDKLIQAIKQIVRICKECDSNNPKIEISCYIEEDNICIAIHHKNSKYGKPMKETVRRIGEKHSLLIKNQLNGLADLYIEADFDNNEFARVNIWNGKPRKEEIMTEVEGVKYILKF